MKRLAALTLLVFGLLAPIALTGCGETKTDIKATDAKPADKAK